MEKKSNKKILIIIGCILVIVVGIIVGTVILKNNSSNTEEVNKKISVLENNIKKAIDKKDLIIADGYYNELKSLIKSNKNVDTTEYDKITKDLQKLKKERQKELLKKVESEYDDETQVTQYVYKGYKAYEEKCMYEAFEKGEKAIFRPIIFSDANANDFYMMFFLIKDKGISFEDIIFNIDGKITNVSKDNIQRKSREINGKRLLFCCGNSNIAFGKIPNG